MIRLSIRRPIAIAMTYLGLGLLGIVAWQRIPIELLPETDLPRLSVVAYWPGASPEVTEAFLTSPIEAVVQQVHGVEKVESVSSQEQGMGTASVQVQFTRDTDMDFARLELSELLAALESELPPGAYRPRVLAYVPEELQEQSTPFLSYTVTGPYTLEALRHHLDEVIAPEIRQVEGVAQVVADGGRDRLLEIELDETRIQALGLPPQLVRQRVMEMEIVQEAGRVNQDGTLYSLSIRERTDSPEEIRKLPLLTNQGRVVRVEDVGVVRDTYEQARDMYRIDGMPAVSFTVFKELRTNTVAVADRVKARLDSIAGLHPAGVHLILDDDESEAIRAQLSDLRFRAMVAAVVIFLVLLLFLRSLRSAAVVFVTIAFSILITIQLVYVGGYSLNVLTLMGLAMGFGLVVDNAIVVLENIYRLRRTGMPPPEAAERGAREVILPVLAATLTTLVVMVPFVYLQGELRVFYVPLALVVGFSLLASLFVAFTLIPALAGRRAGYRSSVIGHRSSAVGAGLVPAQARAPTRGAPTNSPLYRRFYAGLTGWTLRFPWVTVFLALLMFGGSFYLFDKYVTRGVVWGRWGMDDTYIAVRITMPRGEELGRTDQLVRYFEERIGQMPEVERFVTNVQPQYASIRVTFPDSLEMTAVPVAIKEQMVAFSHGFGGVEVRVIGYGPSFYGGGSSPPNYSIQVLGYNYEKVREIAEDLGRRLTGFARIQEVDTNSYGSWYEEDRATEMVLRIDRAALAMHRLTTRDIVNHVRAAVAGREGRGSVVRVDGEELSFTVKLEGSRELDALALPELLIPAPSGEAVRLGSVATLDERQLLSRILREDQQYQRRISYQFRGPTKLGDVVRDVVVDATALPPGYTLVTENEWSWSVEEKEQIYGVLAVALLLVFMVTAAVFESLRQPLIVLLTVPMALIGVFLIFFYTGASFTREAYIGVIMMGGIVVNNAILLVDHINARRRETGLQLHEAVLQGTMERVRPILMTSATTIFGLLPLVLFSDYADANIWNALGYALIGGLASSTFLVLTVSPALYLLFERRRERKRVGREQTATIPAGMQEAGT
ncbi:MAG TPA: efflux RND transporter permease subunit [Longimicrobiaceae bacterium]|nr:efflux RND transporter permease subunit [Longimicrobiaceae bacterium]